MKVENGYSYDDTPVRAMFDHACRQRASGNNVRAFPFTWLQQSYGTDGGDPMARADLAKMKIQALRKYTKLYEVQGVHPQSSREDLIAAIKRHWSMAVRKCRQRHCSNTVL
jgi:hypothetical protein